MFLFVNPEIKKLSLWLVAITVLGTILGFAINIYSGLLVLCVCIALITVFLFYTKARYRDIGVLCDKIDNLLYGNDNFNLENFKEGELSVLHDEIYKMTIMLREKNEALKKDKTNLTEAIENISHQLKTPLTSVNILLSFLSKNDLSDEKKSELLYEIISLLSRIDWLITSLLKMSRINAGVAEFRKDNISVKNMLKKAVEPLEIALDLKNIDLSMECEDNVRFLGDSDWTAEAIGNIIKNCLEHTPSGGKIEIKAEENPIFTQVTISDNGTGIDKSDIKHIFKRFYKGKTSFQTGFGIGLALSSMLISNQNGTIQADNNKYNGACFTIKFYHDQV